MEKLNIADLRRSYDGNGLVVPDLPDNPMDLFTEWMKQAMEAEVADSSAMSLATVDHDGHPDVRTVLLKSISDTGISFFTNYKSSKGRQLSGQPYAACCFWWAELSRQVRIRGPVHKLDNETSEQYFAGRPRESQISAWASEQSSTVKDREELERRFNEFEMKFKGQDIPKPDSWGGYEVQIETIEFWQGRPGRLHDRIFYEKSDENWARKRLAP